MCSEILRVIVISVMASAMISCSLQRKLSEIKKNPASAAISVVKDDGDGIGDEGDGDICEIDVRDEGDPMIMNAIRDSETGEMVATDVIAPSKVTARFRNVAERSGTALIEFDVTVPGRLVESAWQLRLCPVMSIGPDEVRLDPVFITGEHYREAQLKGYERYRTFLNSIVTDSTDFITISQFEIFLRRCFPEIYAMKSDSTYYAGDISDVFGVTRDEVLAHYTRYGMMSRNNRRKLKADKMFRRYVGDIAAGTGIKLDTVVVSDAGELSYRYVQNVRIRPGTRKIGVILHGDIFEDGRSVCSLPASETLTYYISSLSSLTDDTPRYRKMVLERTVYDNTNAFIDFEPGSSVLDTLREGNARELCRIRECIAGVFSRNEYVADSIVITASCSPEGSVSHNKRLSAARAESVSRYMDSNFPSVGRTVFKTACIPENWERFSVMVENDSVISARSKRKMLSACRETDPDEAEESFRSLPEYRYLREKVYPKLRTVRFDFYLHRKGMVKDTVYTSELDHIYKEGVDAIRLLEYNRAVELLRPYKDYNSALAFLSAGYDESALNILETLDKTSAKTCYLMAVALARLGSHERALEYYRKSIFYDGSMRHRGNLDPEIFHLIEKHKDKF